MADNIDATEFSSKSLRADVARPIKRGKCKRRVHGEGRTNQQTPEYKAWLSMRYRCLSPTCPEFHLYGGRGIKVCARWDSYKAFVADVGRRPSPQHSLDRYPDGNGHYEPDNVRWATDDQQNNNRPGFNIRHTINGQTLSVAQWARTSGLRYHLLWGRLRRGLSMQQAIALGGPDPIKAHYRSRKAAE